MSIDIIDDSNTVVHWAQGFTQTLTYLYIILHVYKGKELKAGRKDYVYFPLIYIYTHIHMHTHNFNLQ